MKTIALLCLALNLVYAEEGCHREFLTYHNVELGGVVMQEPVFITVCEKG